MALEVRGIVWATLSAAIALTILVGLGVWQLERKEWKENLIATLNERTAKAPEPLPPRESWSRLSENADEFRRVTFPVEFIPGEEALVYSAGSPLRSDVKGPGYWVFAPGRLPGGSIVVINRGFVPLDRKDAATRREGTPPGTIDVTGALRWPEPRGMFVPADDPQSNVWYLRDHKAMAAAKKWNSAAPFYIDQEEPVPSGGWPSPGKLTVNLPNNHLQYAITWLGLALTLIGVYGFWLRGRLRRPL